MTIAEIFEASGVDTAMFCDVFSFQSRQDEELTRADFVMEELKRKKYNDSYIDWLGQMPMELMHVSDYNRVAELYGNEKYQIEGNEYIVVCDYDSMLELYNGVLKQGKEITVGNKSYIPKYQECMDGFVMMASSHINFGFMLLPDDAGLSGYSVCQDYYIADYAADSTEEKDKIIKYIDSKKFDKQINPADRTWSYVNTYSKSSICASSIGIAAMAVFTGIYLGLVFMIAGAAILALKELSETADNREKYWILRRIGVDEHLIRHSLFAQCALFFGIPLVFAMVHSIFGIQVSSYILESLGEGGLMYSILTAAGMILAVYGVYFVLTYLCCKKIISEV